MGKYTINYTHANSKIMHTLFRFAAFTANSNAVICISGEKGVGKDVLASYIHKRSRFSGEQLLRCSPQMMDRKTAENTLHNAFHHRTTVVIDDILDSPPYLQQSIYDNISKLQGRLIAITRHNCEEAYENGTLLPELYYSLQLLPIHIPPLRERKQDIISFTEYFLKQIAKEYNIPDRIYLAPDAGEQMLKYAWLGNLDELRCVLTRAVLLCKKNTVQLKDLFLCTTVDERMTNLSLKENIRQCKRSLIIKTLLQHDGNQTHSARTLGIQRTYLLKLMKELSIKEEITYEQNT